MSICIETITKPFLRLLDFSEPQFIIIIIYYNILLYYSLFRKVTSEWLKKKKTNQNEGSGMV